MTRAGQFIVSKRAFHNGLESVPPRLESNGAGNMRVNQANTGRRTQVDNSNKEKGSQFCETVSEEISLKEKAFV